MYLQAICNCWIKLITHHFKLSEVEKAYDVFKHAGENHALKVIIEMISVNKVATNICS